MKKLKWTILTLAILLSVGGAFASRSRSFGTLYYWTGTTYMPAGIAGINYVCETSEAVCTYTYSNGVYTPYNTASTYVPIGVTTPTAKPAPEKEK